MAPSDNCRDFKSRILKFCLTTVEDRQKRLKGGDNMCFDDDFWNDFDVEDAILLGSIGAYFEEEAEEFKQIEKEQEVDEEIEEDDYEKLIP